jgi:dolichol-phosphate mannosyltransferase
MEYRQHHYYNIHNIVKVESDVLLYELEYFRASAVDKPDLNISVKEAITSGIHFKNQLKLHPFHNHSYTVSYSEHFGHLGAEFAIEFLDNFISIAVNRLLASSRHVVYVNLVEPLLRFLLISKGFVLLHSACIDIENRGILISAPPDTGKTTLVLKCIKSGFSFLSDDMTIIHLPDGAICFPKPMTLSSHTLQTALDVSNTNHNLDNHGLVRPQMRLRSLIHSKSGRGFMRKLGNYKNVPIFTVNTVGQRIVRPPKFRVEDILHTVNIKNKTDIKKLYFLETGSPEQTEIVTSAKLSTSKAIENSDDAFLFPPYSKLIEYITINGKSAKELLLEEANTLEKFLQNIKCYLTKSANKKWYPMIANQISPRIRI